MKIAILGDFDISDNYPNTKHLLAMIESDTRFEVIEISPSAANPRNLYKATKHPLRAIGTLWNMFSRALRVSWKIRKTDFEDCEVVYVPYPATIILFLYSLLPGRSNNRPLLVMDCFISLYDTAVLDRALVNERGLAARLLRYAERRAVSVADLIIADTQANADYLQGILGGRPAQWIALNLCINESLFQNTQTQPSLTDTGAKVEVLFIGSFVPLQGVDVVVKAAILLRDRTDIHFRLLGDGQTAAAVETLLKDNAANLDWDRNWHPIEYLAERYQQADVCLGIFGATEKAARVLPYKVYMGFASGKPVISRNIKWSMSGAQPIPIAGVDENSPGALAAMICQLADSPINRAELGAAGRRFYEKQLSNRIALDGFYSALSARSKTTER